MKIVTIIENNPITGVRYGTVDINEYNDRTKRRIDRNNRFCQQLKQRRIAAARKQNTKNK